MSELELFILWLVDINMFYSKTVPAGKYNVTAIVRHNRMLFAMLSRQKDHLGLDASLVT